MKFATSVLTFGLLIAAAHADAPDESWEVHGQVVDEPGEPVEGFVAASFWSSNGRQWDDTGKLIKIESKADYGKMWKQEGILVPHPQCLAKQMTDGHFNLEADLSKRPRISVFATDILQQRGGLVSVEKIDAAKPVTIALLPMVRVTGEVYCSEAGKTPGWTMAVVHPPGDMGNYLHFTHCGSLNGKFSFLLPPGQYDFDVYSQEPNARMPKPHERKPMDAPIDMPKYLSGIRITVPRGQLTLDLGRLDVVPVESDTLDPLTEYYGKKPPELTITDVRGASKSVRLADLRGKWILLDFWGLHCQPCIQESLPKLSKFYDEHQADRDRFEILAVCWNEEVLTIEDYDRQAALIAEKFWAGKPLPFPVLFDGNGKTFDDYCVLGIPQSFLIDPDGNLVKGGDEGMLAAKLKQ
jgi:thiol-disulfide isomerase/thioredoxin